MINAPYLVLVELEDNYTIVITIVDAHVNENTSLETITLIRC